MAANAKILKRRIKSVANTRKITKAMEMVAASKMRRIVSLTLKARPYAELSFDAIKAVFQALGGGVSHSLLEPVTSAEKSLVLLFTSDRGLAGSFNSNVIKKALNEISALGPVDAITIGGRGALALARKKIPVIASFEGFANEPKYSDILPVASIITEKYLSKEYKTAVIIYTEFISALKQDAVKMELLPLGRDLMSQTETKNESTENDSNRALYEFEPNPERVLDSILPKLVETMIYQKMLESAASEHSARMMAMRNATDAAGEMLSDLKFTYNQIRQAGITQEIAEISSGAAAVE